MSYDSSKISFKICTQPDFTIPPINKHYDRLANTKAFYKYIIYNIPNCKNDKVQKLNNKNISSEASDLLAHLFTWYDIIHSLDKEDIEEQILVFNLLLKNETKEFQIQFNSLKDKDVVDLINNN